jgi:rfaE bifunctional protein nucleotidyltransferase chain/domain
MNPKIVTLARLKKILQNNRNKRVVFTNGCFDILHLGHVKYLAAAKAKGDMLVVGLNTDASVRKLKGKSRPVNPQKDRAEVLAALEAVDFIVLFHDDTPYRLISAIAPDVLVKGGDWKKSRIVGADIVLANGGRVAVIPFVKGRSTTRLIHTITRLG